MIGARVGLTRSKRLFISNDQQFRSFERTRARVDGLRVHQHYPLSPSPTPIPAHRYYPAGLAPSSRAHLLLSAAALRSLASRPAQMVPSVPTEAAVPGLIAPSMSLLWALCNALRRAPLAVIQHLANKSGWIGRLSEVRPAHWSVKVRYLKFLQ